MGKVYSLSPVELRSGIDREEFEAFARQSLQQLPPLSGWRFTLLKGERGEHVGHYQVLGEIDSIETRDAIAPTGGTTPQQQEWFAAATPILEQWRQYTTMVPGLDAPGTDYHDITDG